MLVSETIARLRAELSERRDIRFAGAAEFAAIDQQRTARGDQVYVVLQSESAPDSETIGLARALVSAELAIIIAHTDRADRRGEGAISSVLDDIRTAVRGALYGWQAPSADSPLLFRSGGLVAAENGQVWWQDIYHTSYLISQND